MHTPQNSDSVPSNFPCESYAQALQDITTILHCVAFFGCATSRFAPVLGSEGSQSSAGMPLPHPSSRQESMVGSLLRMRVVLTSRSGMDSRWEHTFEPQLLHPPCRSRNRLHGADLAKYLARALPRVVHSRRSSHRRRQSQGSRSTIGFRLDRRPVDLLAWLNNVALAGSAAKTDS